MKQKNLLFRIFLVIFLVAVAGIIGLLVRDHIQKDKDQKLREKAAVSVQEEPEVSAEAEETPVQIPVDFSVLQAENPDIYAWIHIADTPVDYPILQSKVDDDFCKGECGKRIMGRTWCASRKMEKFRKNCAGQWCNEFKGRCISGRVE